VRNYCLATYDPEALKEENTLIPECWAFLSIGTDLQEAEVMSELLDVGIGQWIQKDHWVVAFDLVYISAWHFPREVMAKRWEMQELGITYEWSEDIIPGTPPEAREGVITNTFKTEELFLSALWTPLVLSDETRMEMAGSKYGELKQLHHIPKQNWESIQ
jgi:hypothetical protein